MEYKLNRRIFAILIVIIIDAIACKREKQSSNGLTPSSSNTTFAQTMSVQINGNTWLPDSNIIANIYDTENSNPDYKFRTRISDTKRNVAGNEDFIKLL